MEAWMLSSNAFHELIYAQRFKLTFLSDHLHPGMDKG